MVLRKVVSVDILRLEVAGTGGAVVSHALGNGIGVERNTERQEVGALLFAVRPFERGVEHMADFGLQMGITCGDV